MDNYQSFIYKSRYARWLPEEGRREEWPETVDRYFKFFEKHLREKYGYVEDAYNVQWLKNKVLNLEVMPSMRCLMTAGPALERSNIAGYNCSYLVIDKPESFYNLMLILLNGTGVGFSVERQYVSQMPEVPAELTPLNSKIVVEDSKEGWAEALLTLLKCLYRGEIPEWDLSKIRPAGSRLNTFGGRASGPGPLDELFHFVVDAFKKAKGRKLSSIECHDIACKIGEVVVVGGVAL